MAAYLTKMIKSKYNETICVIYIKSKGHRYIAPQSDHYTASNNYLYVNVTLTYIDNDFNIDAIDLRHLLQELDHTAYQIWRAAC